jgi:diguanylate cyclase (GGDEF)-like protein
MAGAESEATPMEFPVMSGSRRLGTLLLTPAGGFDVSLHPLASAAANILGCLLNARFATEDFQASKDEVQQLRQRNQQLQQQFETSRRTEPGLDAETGLPNAPLFHVMLGQATARSRRGKQTLAVLHLELDRFAELKIAAGDEPAVRILKQIADRLKRNCREGDTVARGADYDFYWSISNVQKLEDVAILAEKALEIVNRPVAIGDQEHTITTSIGIGVFPVDGGEPDSLLKAAQAALNRARELGRDNYQFYTEELSTRILEQLTFKRRLRDAMDRGEFILHYQPILATVSRGVEGVEALIRWQKPEGNLSYPGDFMPASESAGLTARMDEWVISKACEQVKRWSSEEGKPLRVTVNVSAHLFEDTGLPWKITNALKEAGIRPEQLELDISQPLLMTDIDVSNATLRRLKQTGVRLSIDDFGSGMLDLDCLREFPVDAIKIDPAFVRDIHTNPYTSAVTAGIISLAHSLKIHSVAKGVENEDQLKHLSSLGCEAFQGNLYSAAVAAGEIQTFLDRSRTITVIDPVTQKVEPQMEIESTESVRSQWMEPGPAAGEGASAVKKTGGGAIYLATCFHCGSIFNAIDAEWCKCIVTENTLVCSNCGNCFCSAPVAFKMDFWSDAPQVMWERRMKEDSAEEPLAPNPPVHEVRRPSVLVVDDERAILLAATRALRGYGITAMHASSGNEGLELTRKYMPDLVITDALMPKLDGREMCRMIKLDPRLSRVKVAIVTSLETGTRERASAMRDYKADEYLQKPMTRDQLIMLLKKFAILKN